MNMALLWNGGRIQLYNGVGESRYFLCEDNNFKAFGKSMGEILYFLANDQKSDAIRDLCRENQLTKKDFEDAIEICKNNEHRLRCIGSEMRIL